MTLVFDNKQGNEGAPGLHAFIVGMSEYVHLPGIDDPPNLAKGFGMKQLASAAFSACSVFERLTQLQTSGGDARLAVPLKTCRMLLAPSPLELQTRPALQGAITQHGIALPTYDNFCTAAQAWRADASDHKNNIALFYFSGHGVRTHTEDAVLALRNFADPNLPAMQHCVKVSNLHLGMAPTAGRPEIARAQLYFVDACRNMPEGMTQFAPMEAQSVWDIGLNSMIDDRSWPIFFAAAPNQIVHGRRGNTSFFCDSLLNGLSSAAEEPEDDPDNPGQERWIVTPDALATGIERHLTRLLKLKESFLDVKGVRGKSTIVYLRKPPEVEVDISVLPSEIAGHAEISVIDGRQPATPVTLYCEQLTQADVTKKLPAGLYHVRLRSGQLANDYQSNNKFINQKTAKPWVHRVSLKPGT